MITPTSKEIHDNAVAHGWYEDFYSQRISPDFIPAKLALIHSEVSEALEAYRKDGMPDPKADLIPGQGSFVEEMADVVIRVFDLCAALGLDIEAAMRVKHEYNKGRPYKHGGKVV